MPNDEENCWQDGSSSLTVLGSWPENVWWCQCWQQSLSWVFQLLALAWECCCWGPPCTTWSTGSLLAANISTLLQCSSVSIQDHDMWWLWFFQLFLWSLSWSKLNNNFASTNLFVTEHRIIICNSIHKNEQPKMKKNGSCVTLGWLYDRESVRIPSLVCMVGGYEDRTRENIINVAKSMCNKIFNSLCHYCIRRAPHCPRGV